MKLTVIIPTHSPRESILNQTIDGLRSQTLSTNNWELLIIDNASPTPVSKTYTDWHPNGRIVREETLGLTHARLRALKEASAAFLVWVDDDNILDNRYLENTLSLFQQHPNLGIGGGISEAIYEEPTPSWFEEGLAPLGCRNLGNEEALIPADSQPDGYPDFAPIGAGMICQKEAIQRWADEVAQDPARQKLGRTGQSLTSGEDNDMNLTALKNGYDLGYFPQLHLKHIIPPGRLTLDYQKRMARVSFRDFVRVLDIHGIRPWPAIHPIGVWPRALKQWIRTQAWRSPKAAIQWSGALGQFEGRALLEQSTK